MKDTGELLRAFTEKGSEDAFQELVARYIDLVYSVALRRVDGNAHQAQDVAQTVFIDFAGKARSLSSGVQLGGWLHRHTCFVAGNFTRAERRRQAREQIAVQMNTLSETHDSDWKDVAPVLDDAIDQLDDSDRVAVLLRFYEQCDLRRVGVVLGVGEDAAQKRVSRALDKLREMLMRRGVALSVAALVTALGAQAVIAAPAGLAKTVARRSLAKAAAGAGILGSLLGLLAPTAAKVCVASVALVVILAVKWQQGPVATTNQSVPQSNRSSFAQDGATNASSQASLANDPTVAAAETILTNPEIIRLTILTADSGKPVPNVVVDYRGWVGKKFTEKKFTGNRDGICDVSVSRETLTDLQLTTRIDSFADTRLFWRPDRGEQIPTNYTVRLERSVLISGRVVDADHQPVEGAKVGFGHKDDPASEMPPQDHQFTSIEVFSDAEGRWKIDRIAPGMIWRIYGTARHSNHVSSTMDFISRDDGVEQQLREGTHVFRLGRSLSIRGMVVGPDDQPVLDARVFVGGLGSGSKPEAVTGFDGLFAIAGCKPGKNFVTAEAKGFAPVTIEVQAAADLESVRLKLEPGKALILRVVDRVNRPVPGTSVFMNAFDRRDSSSDTPPVQVEFNPKTDSEGRAVWENAPDREMTFDFGKAGYMRLEGLKIRPDGLEHVVTLQPALKIFGTVHDESGDLVPRFRVVIGWPSGPAEGDVMWSTLERFWLSFAGGEYQYTFEEPVVGGTANRGYVLKFEAENYASFISRIIRADEGEVRLDVVLQKASAAKITFQLPDGRPAKNADIGLVSPGARLQLVPGGFSRINNQNGAALRKSDDQGCFQLSADPTVTRVIVAHNEGHLEVTPAALADQPIVRLKPWGRIEGTFMSGVKPAAGRYVQFQLGYGDFNSVATDPHLFQTLTDVEGHFTFAQAPPGQHKLVRVLPETNGAETSWAHSALTDVEVPSGETKTITVGGVGYTVTARVRWPEGFKRDNSWRTLAAITTPFPAPPIEVLSNPEALAKWRSSPEIQSLTMRVRRYPLTEMADGSWQAEDVPAGNYKARINVLKTPAQVGGTMDQVSGGTEVVVPADPSSGIIDIGEIVIR